MSNIVLFVDDEKNVLNSLNRLCADTEMKILNAANAGEALNFFSKEKISVIVSDNQMPGMKGVDLLSKIKEIDICRPLPALSE